ncbi:hypothetical protein I7I48_05223 [Histoplasma ohiense]|nr:hypothetical protein I7I48_05223 [Histoplasma ohiense (nom. inval.)]
MNCVALLGNKILMPHSITWHSTKVNREETPALEKKRQTKKKKNPQLLSCHLLDRVENVSCKSHPSEIGSCVPMPTFRATIEDSASFIRASQLHLTPSNLL